MKLQHPRNIVLCGLLAILLSGAVVALAAPPDDAAAPQYDRKGDLIFPADYREWVFVSAGLDMVYKGENTGPSNGHVFENVFVPKAAYRYFLKTGSWPDKTVLFMERRNGATDVSINVSGAVQTETLQGMSAHVKDVSRFKDSKGWAFFGFAPGDKTGSKIATSVDCYSCHEAHAGVDTTFVQFYPTLLPIAISHGTYKPADGSPPPGH